MSIHLTFNLKMNSYFINITVFKSNSLVYNIIITFLRKINFVVAWG